MYNVPSRPKLPEPSFINGELSVHVLHLQQVCKAHAV
jgi:hypothetical protein